MKRLTEMFEKAAELFQSEQEREILESALIAYMLSENVSSVEFKPFLIEHSSKFVLDIFQSKSGGVVVKLIDPNPPTSNPLPEAKSSSIQ
jgi:hypothetical protein